MSTVNVQPTTSARAAVTYALFGVSDRHRRDLNAVPTRTEWYTYSMESPEAIVTRVSEALCMRFNPQSRRRVRNNDCCVPEEA